MLRGSIVAVIRARVSDLKEELLAEAGARADQLARFEKPVRHAFGLYQDPQAPAQERIGALRTAPGHGCIPVGLVAPFRGARAALHTKAMVFDRKAVFIGSFNLDPRSAVINTEAGLYIESPELAARLTAYMAAGAAPANS
ncbi:phospholipase D-like domain-containing protein [Rhizobiaceae bacterium n13]|uniref:Phospholipase D n=1 Tax=Ferirhizobium litorale TaxID=2927786 RepID=A0AAE3QI47_9HYPH|nr:phospholipase D-like domain-containing protein [Fererhizobium litorale]MDI7862859.1 phospholipase D-like domain-containing protein [Fererhizobium litorale]MDI7923945.1 phospholipase D-like domain-containing protein [Fererhizobium litorale]